MSYEVSAPLPSEPDAVSHDKLCRTLFQAFFRDLIELLHAGLADCLDLDHVEFVAEKVFADFKIHGHRLPDLVGRTTTLLEPGSPQFVIVHIEAENRYSSEMEERMQVYQTQLWLKYRAPIVSIVIFLHGGPPGVQRIEVRQTVGPWETSRFAYLSFGLSGSLAEEWLQRPQVLVAALAAMMKSREWDKVEQKLHCLRVAAEAPDLRRRFLLTNAVDVYLPLKTEEERVRFEAALTAERDEVKNMVITFDEALAEREAIGEARGKAIGEARGEARGKAIGEALARQATRESIEMFLRFRFGSVPVSVHQKLEAISDFSRLRDLLDAAQKVASLAQFEAALPLQ